MKHSQDHTRGRSPQKQPVSRVSAKNRCIDNIDASIATNDSMNRPVGRLIRVQRQNRAKGEPDRYTSKHFVETDAFWGGSYPAGISAVPPSTGGRPSTEGQRGCFRAKARRICGVRAGRYQTPRAWNSPSNCIAWRRTNDCIFGSRHRVNRKTRVHGATLAIRTRSRLFFFSFLFFLWCPSNETREKDIRRETSRWFRERHRFWFATVSLRVNENTPANEMKVRIVERDKGEACSPLCRDYTARAKSRR